MGNNIPKTLVRVGRYDHSLEEAVRGFSEPLEPVPIGLGNTIKYATYAAITESPSSAESFYLLMVSQQKEKSVSSSGYNVILTVTSYSDKKNQQVAEQFERETHIDLSVEVPEWLKRNFLLMKAAFQSFEKNPQAAMDVLRGVHPLKPSSEYRDPWKVY